MRKKAMLSVMAGFMLVGLTACGGNNGNSASEQPSGNPAESNSGSTETTTIKFWQFMGSMDESSDINIAPIIQEFEEANPGIKVEVQQLSWDNGLDKITTSFAADEAPDVVELGNTWVTQFASQGALMDLTDRVAGIKDTYAGWDGVEYDNELYGVPWLLGTRALFYNKDIFEEAGLDPEKPPATWDELQQYAEQISANTSAKGFGIAAGEAETPWTEFSLFLWSNGGDFLNADQTASALSEPAAVEALEYYHNLSKFSLVAQDGMIGQEFSAGTVGMFISGAWNLRSLPTNAPDLNFGVAVIPAAPSGDTASFGGGEILSISAKTKVPDEAYKLIEFMTAKENAMKITEKAPTVFPPYGDIAEDPFFDSNPNLQVFASQLSIAKNPPSLKQWQPISAAVTTAIEETVFDQATPEEALKKASDTINSLLGQ